MMHYSKTSNVSISITCSIKEPLIKTTVRNFFQAYVILERKDDIQHPACLTELAKFYISVNMMSFTVKVGYLE